MPTFNSLELLQSLQNDVHAVRDEATQMLQLPQDVLMRQPAPESWSALQAIEHLNSYGRYYLAALKNTLDAESQPKVNFKAGWFGNYFTKMMKPGENGKVANKMQAPKDHRPLKELSKDKVLTEFIAQQNELIQLLDTAKQKDIGALRTPISITRMMKLKAGDTFRFLIAHEQRHMLQAKRALGQMMEGGEL